MSRSDNYIAELEKKVKRLEDCIKADAFFESCSSPREVQGYIDEIYEGKHDEYFEATIKECIKAYK